MDRTKVIIVIIILSLTLIAAYTIPRAQYKGTGFISQLSIPLKIADWSGRDIKESLNLDFDKNWNKFISEAMIYEYMNRNGQRLVFIILDAGNFHHPNVCFTAAGYEIKELEDTEFNISGRSYPAHTLYTTKGQETNLSFYWIVIDKKIVHSWIEQKIKQLYFSLFNRKRVGLMVRFDIPATEKNINEAKLQMKNFITQLIQVMPSKQADFIFGRSN